MNFLQKVLAKRGVKKVKIQINIIFHINTLSLNEPRLIFCWVDLFFI